MDISIPNHSDIYRPLRMKETKIHLRMDSFMFMKLHTQSSSSRY